MSWNLFLKNQLPSLLINFAGILALVLFLTANGNPISVSLLIAIVWIVVMSLYGVIRFLTQKRHLCKLLDMAEHRQQSGNDC